MSKLRILKKKWEFERAYRHGKKLWNDIYVVYVYAAPGTPPAEGWRCGITATKKYGNSVARNRAKRLIRESLRLSGDLIRDGLDIVVVVRSPATELKCADARRYLFRLLARGGALKSNDPTLWGDTPAPRRPRYVYKNESDAHDGPSVENLTS